ncbi:MAG: hypothetical protein JW932_13490 [Deltaproteobacteria bacterium]|nr:hypothetical protein [Deltaproteobacteria bacterium]
MEESFGKILRVDLSSGNISTERLDEKILQDYVGGACLGIRIIYDEVPPDVAWSDPENRLFLGTGPLGGTLMEGSGAVAVVTKGAMTNGIASSQANGFFGAYLTSCGLYGIILQGAARKETFLHIQDDRVEIRDASHLKGLDTFRTEEVLKSELNRGKKDASVLTIGPAGENLVRFALISTDMGHMAAHNGVGAVMGSKRLKAVVVDRGKHRVFVKDKKTLINATKEARKRISGSKFYLMVHTEGTVGGVQVTAPTGLLPIKNYSTNIVNIEPEQLEQYSSENIRNMLDAKPTPCWMCSGNHCHMGRISGGKLLGREVEEPEYEAMSAWSTLVGISDPMESVSIANEVDRLGLNTNEAGWVISWLMECYEKGILNKNDLDGIEMSWGNFDSIVTMLRKIAHRQGFGNVLAEGVKRASERVGKNSSSLAIYTKKGNTPRTHDHRVKWVELFDTCVSNTGTLEMHDMPPFDLLGLPPLHDPFDPLAVSTLVAKAKGAMIFEDSMVTCRFRTMTQLDLLCQAINAVTGWHMNVTEAMRVGKRAVNVARVFNLRNGIGPGLDSPSPRYGSTPLDGVAEGKGILPHWDRMLSNYYHLMGWDSSGVPLAETLENLDLQEIIPDLLEWKEKAGSGNEMTGQ